MKSTLTLILLFLLCFNSHSQHLKQKGFIGVAPQPIGESVAKFLGIDPGNGVIVKAVIPGSAAARMGILENDIIHKINNKPIKSPKDVVDISGACYEGEEITFEVNRNKELLIKKGVITARPMGYPENVEISLDEFPIEGGYTRTLLFRPKGSATGIPTIYLIQGYPCFSMQYLQPDFPYRTAINAFVAKGYAVFVVEKPGMGDGAGSGTQTCSQIGFDKELEVFQKGFEKLKTLKGIDKDKIFIFGHSLGGFIAPLIAQRETVRGVVVYGCGLKPWHDYLLDLVREQTPYQGVDYAAAEDSVAKYRSVYYKYFFKGMSPEQLIAEDPTSRMILNSALNFDGRDQLIQRHFSFWQELNRHNLAAAWKNTNSPVLSIFGESDIAALKATDMERIAEIVNHYRPGYGTYLFVPKTNHDMIKTGTMKENMKVQFSPGYNQYLKNNFNHEMIGDIDKWIKTQLSR